MGADAIEQARLLLPGWVGWAGTALTLASGFLIAWLCAGLASWLALWPLRRAGKVSWIEHSRLTFPARIVTALMVFFMPALVGVVGVALWRNPLSRVPEAIATFLAVLVTWLPAYIVRVRADNRIRAVPIPLGYRLRSTASLMLVFYPGFVVAFAANAVLPNQFSLRAAVILVIAALLIVMMPWGLGVRLASLVGLVQPAPERLTRIVDGVAERIGFRPKGLHVMTWGTVNALALVLPGWLVFTDASLLALSDEELASVTAHEIGHLTEPPSVRWARATGGLLPIPFAAVRPVAFTWGPWGIVAIYVAFFAAVVLLRRVGRRMEVRADATAQRYEGDVGAYARALERIYELNRMPVATGHRRHAHPDLYDRLEAAGVTPSYPRPERPPRLQADVAGLAGVVLALSLTYGVRMAVWPLLSVRPFTERTYYWSAALLDPTWGLSELARHRFGQGDYASSAVFYNACTALDQWSVLYPANLALVLARAGRCAEGSRAYSLAVERFRKGRGEHDQDWDALQGAINQLATCDSDAAERKRFGGH